MAPTYGAVSKKRTFARLITPTVAWLPWTLLLGTLVLWDVNRLQHMVWSTLGSTELKLPRPLSSRPPQKFSHAHKHWDTPGGGNNGQGNSLPRGHPPVPLRKELFHF